MTLKKQLPGAGPASRNPFTIRELMNKNTKTERAMHRATAG